MHSADYLAMCLCDLNGYVSRHIDGLDGVHGGDGEGHRNFEEKMLLVARPQKQLCVKYVLQERGKEEDDIHTDTGIELWFTKKTLTVSMKYEGNPKEVSTCTSCSANRSQ